MKKAHFHRHKRAAFALLALALFMASCSPYRVKKRAPSGKGVLSILDFKRSSCGCK